MTATEKTERDLIKAYEREYDITLEALPETVRVRGNASASGDDELDRDEENAILARLDMGDVWAWFTAKVTVRDSHGREASDYLGCCSYKDEKDFKRGGYYLEMIKVCVEEIENADPLEIEEDPETSTTMKNTKLTTDQHWAIRCACADLIGSLEGKNKHLNHDWKGHKQTIADLMAAFPDVLSDFNTANI